MNEQTISNDNTKIYFLGGYKEFYVIFVLNKKIRLEYEQRKNK